MRPRRPAAALLATCVAAGLAGCGSAGRDELPPAAEPAPSPALQRTPAGRVVAAVAAPEALALDARSRRRVTVAGRDFAVDERRGTVAVLRRGRRVGALRVALEPRGVAAADRGRLVAVVSGRERVLELFDPRTLRRVGRANAGLGPTRVVSAAGLVFVTDTAGGSLLVFRVRPRLQLVRRVDLPGSPYGLAVDPVRNRLWVTLTARNELVELPSHGRPYVLTRLPTVRQPDAVAIDPSSGRVAVRGATAGVVQLLDAPGQQRR